MNTENEYKKKKALGESPRAFKLVRYVGKKCHLACSLDSYGELSLVKSAGAGNTSGEDLCSLGNELSELSNILVINSINLVLAEDANLLSSVHRTECGTLRIVSLHLNSPKNLSDSRFLYYTRHSESRGERTVTYLLEGKCLVVGYFFEVSAVCAAE